jgi:serine/threonine protein kinase
MTWDDVDARVGTTISGKWRLDRVLGLGACGVVYAATHQNGSRMAIKVLRSSAAQDPDFVARFIKEGHIGNLVGHPGAVRTLDDGLTSDGLPYLVMDLLDGETLEARIARVGAIQASEALRIADELLDVLAMAHAHGVVHRDIKPANVFLTSSGPVKLLDFGIAHERVLGATGGTICGLILGTPAFMPPEQALGRWDCVDTRSDLWAVGATLFTALVGRPLREGQTPQHELVVATQPLGSVCSRAPALPWAIGSVLDRALAFQRDARFGTALEMQQAVRAAATSVLAPPAVRTRPSDTLLEWRNILPPRWHRRWWVPAAMLVPMGVLLAVFAHGTTPSTASKFLPDPPLPASAASSAAGADLRVAPSSPVPSTPPLVPLTRDAVKESSRARSPSPSPGPPASRPMKQLDPMMDRF